MKRLNTCEKCGHYDWVHERGECTLNYCRCGKPPIVADNQIEDERKKPDSNYKEETLPEEA